MKLTSLTIVCFYFNNKLLQVLRVIDFNHFNNCLILLRIASNIQKRSLCSQNRVKTSINLKRYDRRENAVCALCACRERAVNNTLQQLLPHRRSVMDAIKRPWERRVDAERTLCTRNKWQIIYFRRISRRPHSVLTSV